MEPPVQLFNTATRSRTPLQPPPAAVRMYFCGPTVYARAHVGNARPFVLGMWLRSWLRLTGYQATLVHNITDVNDKIYAAAPGGSARLADEATEWYLEDVEALGLGMPDHMPRVTDYMREIVGFIEKLIGSGAAYAAEGDVYFRVENDRDYGVLSGQRVAEAEDRQPNPAKENPRHFALWKSNKPGEDTAWDSPWGRGRPGWHIECSVMAEQLLGEAFEIHGGGVDLVFPHHENELAQSRALGHSFAQIWAHNGMLRFTGAKMSKSEGNFTTLREVLDRWGAEVFLVFLLTGHWRKPIDFSDESMAQAASRAQTFRNAFTGVAAHIDETLWSELVEALDDDFDTPKALAIFHRWAGDGHLDLLRRGLDIFSLSSLSVQAEAPEDVVSLAELRERARLDRDFEAADRLRNEIDASGWEVRDNAPAKYTLVPKSSDRAAP